MFDEIKNHRYLITKKDYSFDIVAAFLIGELDEEIYMEQPEGYAHKHLDESGQPMVCRLRK